MRYYAQFMDLNSGDMGQTKQLEGVSIRAIKSKLAKYESISAAYIYDRENKEGGQVAMYKPKKHLRKT